MGRKRFSGIDDGRRPARTSAPENGVHTLRGFGGPETQMGFLLDSRGGLRLKRGVGVGVGVGAPGPRVSF